MPPNPPPAAGGGMAGIACIADIVGTGIADICGIAGICGIGMGIGAPMRPLLTLRAEAGRST